MSQTYAEQPTTRPTPAPAETRPVAAPQPEQGRGKGASPVPHTRGGLPAVPLTVTTVNTMVGLASAAVLTSGPIAAAAATLGTVATSAIATRTARRTTAKAAQRAASATRGNAGQRAGHLSLVKSPAGGRGSSSGAVPRQGRSAPGPAGSGTRSGSVVSPSKLSAAGRRGSAVGTSGSVLKSSPVVGRLAARAGEVKAIRSADREATPSRAEHRTGQTTARRQVADARRAAKTAEKDTRTNQRGRIGRTLAKPGQAARQSLDKARAKNRTAADERTGRKVADARREARKAPLRRDASAKLRKSAARFHGRRVLAALLALPVGLVGMLTTPLGRRLGAGWLMYPGRRLYRHLTGQAADARTTRDAEIRADLADAEQAVDDALNNPEDAPKPVGETVPRAPKSHHAQPELTALGGDVPNTAESGFSFSDTASEMYSAAMNYDPDGMMQVLAAIESMPEGLESIANTFRVLAERSDSEFPLDKNVGEALNEVYTLLMQAMSAAEEVGKAFRGAHESDIARHEDPRTGEEKWDIGNNQ
ncbi:hypothetical protein ACGFX4_27090 [Kitasatospora sp. NPDC048365]|uniref:hypothetical protein n=1 Tax=Kitasatospora sp. NPDC048365 TaxID=3364050 RepID=UPI003716F17C